MVAIRLPQPTVDKTHVIGLADRFRSDPNTAQRLFRSAQRIYCESFPAEERESGRVVRGYIRDEIAGENHPDSFRYLVALKGTRVVGMSSFDVLASGEVPITFWGYVAVAKSQRRTGVATDLIDVMAKSAASHCANVGKDLKALFLEVEKPDQTDDVMRNDIRPNFHHYKSRAGAMIVVDSSNMPHLVYYAQPGMEQTKSGKTANRVELLPVVSLVEAGVRLPFDVELGTVIESGRLIGSTASLPKLSSEMAFGIIKTIMATYEETYGFAARQIREILRTVGKSLDRSCTGDVYLVPIHDTKTLQFEK